MKWTQFMVWITALYTAYYLINFLFDVLKYRKVEESGQTIDELTFMVDVAPQTITIEPDFEPDDHQLVDSLEGPGRFGSLLPIKNLESTGGVDIKQLFALAQADLIECTKAIPY